MVEVIINDYSTEIEKLAWPGKITDKVANKSHFCNFDQVILEVHQTIVNKGRSIITEGN